MPITPEDRLGLLAMEFRGNRDEENRKSVVIRYAQLVDELIASGTWTWMPAFEDMLPSDLMPEAFYTYWKAPSPKLMLDHYLRIVNTTDAARERWGRMSLFDQSVCHATYSQALMTLTAVCHDIMVDNVNWEKKPKAEDVRAALDRLVEAGFMRVYTGDELSSMINGHR